MKIFATARYIRLLDKFLKKHPDYNVLIGHRLDVLEKSPDHPALRLHKLSNRDNEYAIYVDQSIRIIFSREKDTIYLLDIGSHDDVY